MRTIQKIAVPVAIVTVLALFAATVVVGWAAWRKLQGPRVEGVPSSLPSPTLTADDPEADERYAKFFTQQPQWSSCYTDHECAKVMVPMDWADPGGSTIELAVVRSMTAKDPLGSLLMNPGGPGSSGVDYVGQYLPYVVSGNVLKSYQVVGFDPRGVAGSAPVECVADTELDGYLFDDLDPETEQGWINAGEVAQKFADGCAAGTGELLGHVDTVSAARDMDVIRAVVGDERLNFLGKSYGTLLGATYADLFPGKVGRMVLDGALNPASSAQDVAIGQAKGMEVALESYLQDCLSRSGCPFTGSVEDAKQQIRDFFAQVEAEPMSTGDPSRPLTGVRASIGVITPLYSKTAWPQLTAAFRAAFNGDGIAFLTLADTYAERKPDGSYASNIMEAFTAINCLDYPRSDTSFESVKDAAAAITEAAPVFGPYLSYGEHTCAVWPYEPQREVGPVNAVGAPPIVVVGTTNDNATPYPWAVELAEQLSSGVLLTFEGDGHTAYVSGGSQCIDAAVDTYLLRGEAPENGLRCMS